jgi:hypothetical protein
MKAQPIQELGCGVCSRKSFLEPVRWFPFHWAAIQIQ